jgi:hypothetical protein
VTANCCNFPGESRNGLFLVELLADGSSRCPLPQLCERGLDAREYRGLSELEKDGFCLGQVLNRNGALLPCKGSKTFGPCPLQSYGGQADSATFTVGNGSAWICCGRECAALPLGKLSAHEEFLDLVSGAIKSFI